MIIIMGLWLRIGGIITDSFPFTYDVGRDMLAVEKIILKHQFPLIGATTGLSGLFYGPWWYYILSIPFFISGGNPQFIASFMVLVGILTIILIYYFGEKIGGNFLGLILAYFVAFSPMMIGISAQIWNPNFIPFFIVLVLFLINKLFISSKKNIPPQYFFFFGLLLGLILDLEIVFGIIFLIGIGISIFILFKEKIQLNKIFFILAGFLLVLLPRLLFELRHDFLMTRKLLGYLDQIFTQDNSLSFQIHIADTLKIFKSQLDQTLFGQNPLIGSGAIILFAVILLAYYKNFELTKKLYLKFIAIVLVCFIIILSVFPGDIWGHFLIGVPILYILLTSLVISEIKKCINASSLVIYLVLLVLFIVYLNDVKFSINFKPSWEGDAAVYRNQIAVVNYIYKMANGKRFNYVTYTPSVHDYIYQYLLPWYGKKKYGYIASQEKEQLFFLIIEPDYARPFLIKEWLDLRNQDGRKIKEEVVKGGIIVQTRLH